MSANRTQERGMLHLLVSRGFWGWLCFLFWMWTRLQLPAGYLLLDICSLSPDLVPAGGRRAGWVEGKVQPQTDFCCGLPCGSWDCRRATLSKAETFLKTHILREAVTASKMQTLLVLSSLGCLHGEHTSQRLQVGTVPMPSQPWGARVLDQLQS